MNKPHTGVAFGRFQPIHKGHLQYIELAWKQCEKLIIGITNADPLHIREMEADKDRSSSESNPFTFWERKQMIQRALSEYGYPTGDIEVVPFPINYPEYIRYYIPGDVVVYVALLEEWGSAKINLLKSVGLNVQVVDLKTKLTTATKIRKHIAMGESYEALLPASVYAYIREHGLDVRLRSS